MSTHTDSNSGLVAFVGGRLIDGCGKMVENATALIEKDRIQAVAPAVEITLPEPARRYEITGKTIMPGLIDAHVHVGNIEISIDKTARLAPAVYIHLASRNLETDLDLGFTTLRDAGGLDRGFREAVDRGLISGPRLLLSVSPLTPTGGHFDQREAHQNSNRPRNSIGIFPEICDGPDAVRQAAREVLRKGADQVKVAADGGVTSPTDNPGHWQFSIAEMQAAVEIAQAAGTYVMAHAYDPVAIRHCVKAGVRTIEHGNLLDAETAELMASNEVYYVPTLTTFDVLANEGRHELDEKTTAKLEMVRHTAQSAVAHARRAGVKIGSGSDIIGPHQHLKGREFRLKAEVMSPMEAIVSATRINAEIAGLDDRIGTLEPGKIADLIVVNGNPLEDLTLFERGAETVLVVMKAGSIMKDLLSI